MEDINNVSVPDDKDEVIQKLNFKIKSLNDSNSKKNRLIDAFVLVHEELIKRLSQANTNNEVLMGYYTKRKDNSQEE